MDLGLSGCTDQLHISTRSYQFASLPRLQEKLGVDLSRLPMSIKLLLEQALRQLDGQVIREEHVLALAHWSPQLDSDLEIPFKPARVILQDFTGVPAMVDLASLRSRMQQLGKDPGLIEPQVPVDLVIDHSIQVDAFGSPQALGENMELEMKRNQERYRFLKWGQQAFAKLRVFPPGLGICHQVNLEHLGQVVRQEGGWLVPDSLVGTDSHTTMINGLGILGWGVGGIEAEAVMLGQPIGMKIPKVVGFKLYGSLPFGTTATDLVLRVVEMLRQKGVVEQFVEFYGNGLSNLSLADRATIANMAPEYGATVGFFPCDQETLHYLHQTGRSQEQTQLVEAYCKTQGLFRNDHLPEPLFSDQLKLDLSTVEPSLAGPKRPQDRVPLGKVKELWNPPSQNPDQLQEGSVVIAAITSCTNTSNPAVMLSAGLLAKKACERGLKVKPWVKTSLAPGSRVVTDYLNQAGLSAFLDQLGFQTVGYGCTTCIGNSGPLDEKVAQGIKAKDLRVAAVLSGNRNFEGRIHPLVKANFLASPPLVVAYALAGRMDLDLVTEPLGKDKNGNKVMLSELWPDPQEIYQLMSSILKPEMYLARYQALEEVSPVWNQLVAPEGALYAWEEDSTYIKNPPFFQDLTPTLPSWGDLKGARTLAILGDSVTTDHISPAGAFSPESEAGRYLLARGVEPEQFNSYGSRRGHDQVMMRGTFANIRLKNAMVTPKEGGWTRHHPSGEEMTIYQAAKSYKAEGIPLLVFAGKEYGTGSSRDWAAKGTWMLGVKAVVAQSFERIHRSNLVGMGVLPLQFLEGQSAKGLGLTGEEVFDLVGMEAGLEPGMQVTLRWKDQSLPLLCRLDTPLEVDYFKNGGMLHKVLRDLLKD